MLSYDNTLSVLCILNTKSFILKAGKNGYDQIKTQIVHQSNNMKINDFETNKTIWFSISKGSKIVSKNEDIIKDVIYTITIKILSGDKNFVKLDWTKTIFKT